MLAVTNSKQANGTDIKKNLSNPNIFIKHI